MRLYNKIMAALLSRYMCRSAAFTTTKNTFKPSSSSWSTRLFGSSVESFDAAADDHVSSKDAKPDASFTSKSRMPFTAPKTAFDDSMPLNYGSSDPNLPADLEWSKLGLTQELAMFLSQPPGDDGRGGLGFSEGPTPVQKMAIPAILSGCANQLNIENDRDAQSIAFAAATGSGKTLAYLLPIIQALKAEEILHASVSNEDSIDKQFRKSKRPRAIILAPTRELTTQIGSVLKALSHTIKLSSATIVGGEDYGKQKKKVKQAYRHSC